MAAMLTLLLACLLRTVSAAPSFEHGVASGDPLPDACIIWTRVTPDTAEEYGVAWQVATDKAFSKKIKSGEFTTTSERDWTVKVDVTGLDHGKQYYYRFAAEGVESPVGTFRLQPGAGVALDKLHYGVFTCSNYGWGYFNAYGHAATLDLDFWMHVGDYIYEYGVDTYPSESQAARGGLLPTTEILSLEDYRTRYATYRTDSDLQALHASAPLISIWDDHELANNPWVDGAQNHQPETEGSWEQRKEVAVRAYHEWMPTRSGTYGKSDYIGSDIYRRFDMGDLATIQCLETRITARTEQEPPELADAFPPDGDIGDAIDAAIGDAPPDEWNATVVRELRKISQKSDRLRGKPSRQLIGKKQLGLLEEAAGSPAKWLVVAETTNLHDIFLDYAAAPALVEDEKPELAAEWAEALYNITHAGTTAVSASPTCYQRSTLGQVAPVSAGTARAASSNVAQGKYEIVTGYDSWQGYTAERERFYKAVIPAGGNAIVYSGDTHAAFAGMMPGRSGYLGAEFSSAGVTSPSSERGARIPLELYNAAMLAGNNVWMDTRYKGFQRVTLTKEKHHVDFVNLDYCSAEADEASCEYAFDLYAAGVEAPKTPASSGNPDGVPPEIIEQQLAQRIPDYLPDQATKGYKGKRSSLKVVPCYDVNK